jgi:2-dehydro-3-deoxyphosphogluconate aldolase/(4S)-4-hydroxy-2-oxoglutarate aldolase
VSEEVLRAIAEQRVLPVLRCPDPDDAVATSRACARAGMKVVELTRSTPGVESALRELRRDGLVLGLGTLSASDQVRPAARAGARFVVSFAAPQCMVESARLQGLTAIPGALTPTEVLRCVEAGAPAVKLFPARSVTPAYLRDLRTVLPELPVLVTGGVTPDGARAWLDAGALAVGLGAHLGSASTHGEDEVERRAREALELVAEVSA